MSKDALESFPHWHPAPYIWRAGLRENRASCAHWYLTIENFMKEWLSNAFETCTTVQTYSMTTQIHRYRSRTLGKRVKIVFKAALALEPNTINMNDISNQGYCSILLASFEEIGDYFRILQTKDKALGRRVMRFGCDEESFSKWNETLKTCSEGLSLNLNRDNSMQMWTSKISIRTYKSCKIV